MPRARRIFRPSIIPRSTRASMTLLRDARFSGIDFRLFDPRQLHPGADRMSFVFLETEATPFLDGRLVQVDRGEECRDHEAADHPRGKLLSWRPQHPPPFLSGGLDRPAVLLGEVFLRRRYVVAARRGDARLRGLSGSVLRRADRRSGPTAPSRPRSTRSSPPSPSTPTNGAARSRPRPASRKGGTEIWILPVREDGRRPLLRDHPVRAVGLGDLRPAERHILALAVSVFVDALGDLAAGRAVRPLIGVGFGHDPARSGDRIGLRVGPLPLHLLRRRVWHDRLLGRELAGKRELAAFLVVERFADGPADNAARDRADDGAGDGIEAVCLASRPPVTPPATAPMPVPICCRDLAPRNRRPGCQRRR